MAPANRTRPVTCRVLWSQRAFPQRDDLSCHRTGHRTGQVARPGQRTVHLCKKGVQSRIRYYEQLSQHSGVSGYIRAPSHHFKFFFRAARTGPSAPQKPNCHQKTLGYIWYYNGEREQNACANPNVRVKPGMVRYRPVFQNG